MNRLLLQLELSQQEASVCTQALKAETLQDLKSKITFTQKDNMLQVEVDSPDLTSLRAAVNTFLRWINLSTQLMKE